MKLLLTSAGLSNAPISKALLKLAGRPARELKVVFIVTSSLYEGDDKGWLIKDFQNVYKLGFKQVDILDFMSVPRDNWEQRLKTANIIIVGGGHTLYLMHALRKSGMNKLLSRLIKTRVYVGISAGSIVTGPRLLLSGNATYDIYGDSKTLTRNDTGLGFVSFGFRPHLNSPHFKKIRVANLSKLAHGIPFPFYGVDDQSAIVVDGKKVKVVSEGKWKLFNKSK